MTVSQTRGIQLALASAVAYGAMAFLVNLAGGRIPAAELVFIRALVSVLVFVAVVPRRARSLFSKRAGPVWIYGVATAVSITCYFLSLQMVSLGVAKALCSLELAFAVILGWLWFKERPTRREALGMMVIVGANALLYFDELVRPPLAGALVGVLGALGVGISICASRLAARRHAPVVLVLLPSFLVTLTAPLLPGPEWVLPQDGRDILLMVSVAASGLLALLLFSQARYHLSSGMSAAIINTDLAWAMILTVAFSAYSPTAVEWISCGLVGVAVALFHWDAAGLGGYRLVAEECVLAGQPPDAPTAAVCRAAIQQAERVTCCEFHLHWETGPVPDFRQLCQHLFRTHALHKTRDRNCVLICLAPAEQKCAVYFDKGIGQRRPQRWLRAGTKIFAGELAAGGLAKGFTPALQALALRLAEPFPITADDTNELPEEVTVG